MEFCSYFIKEKALFGGYPTNNSKNELREQGVMVFVDLTTEQERENLEKYFLDDELFYINYPIEDRKIPIDPYDFTIFIAFLAKVIRKLPNKKKIYIHCKGGHGRAGIVVACLLCFMYNMAPESALELTTRYHSERKTMRAKWRTLGSPQTRTQKGFVIRLCKPIHFYKAYKQSPTTGFSNFSEHLIKIEDFGEFNTSEAAFQAYKEPDNKEYVTKMENIKIPRIAKDLGRKCKLREDWFDVRNNFMKNILKLKIEQHPEVKTNLLNTFLRPIIEHTKADVYSENLNSVFVKNRLGKMWMKVKNDIYYSYDDHFPVLSRIISQLSK